MATRPVMTSRPIVLLTVRPQPVCSPAMSSQIELRVKPSNVVEPSTTRMNGTVPGMSGKVDSPASGERSRRRPSSSQWTGDMAANFVNNTAKPSARRTQPRPSTTAPPIIATE